MHNFSTPIIQQFKQHIKKGSNHLGIKISENQIDQMVKHAKELILWNKKINLTAIKDPLLMAEKHFIDSIAPIPYLKNEDCLMDMGSGGGFPGIPLKIMNPELKMVLVDASRKKVNFLKHVIRMLDLDNIEAIHSRVEDLHRAETYKNKFDAVISRAFTDLSRFVELASPFLIPDGKVYAMKGKYADKEITPAILKTFQVNTGHYKLPFEKSHRYMIQLSTKP